MDVPNNIIDIEADNVIIDTIIGLINIREIILMCI